MVEQKCESELTCNRCGKTNTEFSTFPVNVSLKPVMNRIGFKPNSWVKRIVYRYVTLLIDDDLVENIHICQRCQSEMFRKLDKNR